MWAAEDDSSTASSSGDTESLYDVLGVGLLASQEELRAAFRRLALSLHPDKRGGCRTAFSRLQDAYAVLKDSQLRAEYDKSLLERLYLEEYLRRYADLVLTAMGLELPLEEEQWPRSSAFAAHPPPCLTHA